MFADLTFVLHRILPTHAIRYIRNIALPMARDDHQGTGEAVFLIVYAVNPVTTFYHV